NSLVYVRKKDKAIVADDMKKIYRARTREEAIEAFLRYKQIWHTKYPKIVTSWERNLPYLLTMYDFPEEVRKHIYSTNQLERMNKEIKRRIKVIEVITGEKTLNKILYYLIMEENEKFKRRRLPYFAKYFSEG
ncbi:MAG: transposase, partial [Spirochaetota bacterium]|nr:transposase [Spirochaetota bacterium]